MRPYPYHIREALGMKVLGISGSARKDGNTAIIMNAVLEELKKAGIETELIQFAGAAIQPCRACWACGGGEGCAVRGDAFCDTFEKVVQADGILLGSPVYSANVSANMQAFLERAAVVADQSPGLLKNKVGAAVAAVRRGGALEAVDTMNHFFLNHEMFVAGSTYWHMVYGQMPGDVRQDQEGLGNMENLGRNMAYLLKKLNA